MLKSMMPDFSLKRKTIDHYYEPEDARMMITDLGMEIPANVLKALTNSDVVLDEFVTGVYLVEDEVGEKIVTDFATIDSQYDPKVYQEGNMIGFTVSYKGERIVFAEFKLNFK